MNKKFFTLIAGLLMLAASLGTGHAAEYATGKPTTTISPELPAIDQVSDRLYQLAVSASSTAALSTAGFLLAMEETTGQFSLKTVGEGTNYDLPSTLWRIRVTKNAEGALSYSFVNVKTNLPLTYVATQGTDISGTTSATISSVSYLGGEVSLWKWQPAVKLDDPSNKFLPKVLTSAYGAKLDSVVTLVGTSALTAATTIALAKYSLGSEDYTTPANQIHLTPFDATPVLLTPNDLNSMLWTQNPDNGKVSFSFTPNVQNSVLNPGNLFTNGSFKATWAVGYPADYSQWDPSIGGTYTSGATAHAAAIRDLDLKRYSYEYMKAKREFGLKIAGLVYKHLNKDGTVDSLDQNGIKAAIGVVVTAATTPTLLTVAGTNPGSQNVPGTAAYTLKNSTQLNTFLTATTTAGTAGAFQKELVQAIVDFAEIPLIDPESDALVDYAITTLGLTIPRSSSYPVNNLYESVYMPTIYAFTTGWAAGLTTEDNIKDLVDAIGSVSGYESEHPNYRASSTPVWSSTVLDGLLTTYNGAKDAVTTASIEDAKDAPNARWISLIVDDKDDVTKNTYLSVDTAYLTDRTDLKFKVKKFVDVVEWYPWLGETNPARLDLNGRFNFQFLWYPTQDSLSIRVGGFAQKLDTQKNWGELNTAENTDLGLSKAVIINPNLDQVTADWNTNNRHILDRNVVKLALLSPTHSELTVGDSEHKAGATPRTTINTLIRIGRTALADNRTTLKSGLYFINLKTGLPDRKSLDGAYKYRHIAADYVGLTWAHEDEAQLVDGKIQNFGYMPAAQWVVEQYPYGDGKTNLVSIYNREYPGIKVENVQLYTAGNGVYALPFSSAPFPNADTLAITEISKTQFPEAYSNEYLGYYKELDDKYYKLDYLSGIKLGNYLKIKDSRTDSLIYVDIKDDKVFFELEEVATNPTGAYGFGATKDHSFKALKRTAYNIRIKAPHLLFADGKYIVKVGNGQGTGTTYTGEDLYAVSAVPKQDAATFFLKENNRIASTPYFALEEAFRLDKLWYESDWRVSVKDGSLYLVQGENFYEKRVSAFALVDSDIYLYRRFDGGTYGNQKEAYGDGTNSPLFLKFFKHNNPYEYLSENSKYNGNYRDDVDSDISFLGLYNIAQIPESEKLSYTFYVDTAYVRNKTVMPQYMLALRPDIQLEDTLVYDGKGQWFDREGNPVSPLETKQDTIVIPRLVKGDYLFNAQDSVAAGNKEYQGKFAYGAEGTTRLAFVTGVHFRDTFYVLPDKYKTYSARSIASDTLALYGLADTYKHRLDANTHYLSTDKDGNITNYKSMVFQFRLIDEQNRRFLIETTRTDREIAPGLGKWVKIQNGVPVISDETLIADAIQNGAEIFDVTNKDINEKATSNEAVAETAVKVISENGAVTILNAAGKSVAISNILGQTVAASVLTSDNARIALPKGIVIVSVEGEAAIKAVVK